MAKSLLTVRNCSHRLAAAFGLAVFGQRADDACCPVGLTRRKSSKTPALHMEVEMKKHWLVTLGVYCLGVATLPGVIGGVRWLRNADNASTPKFIQVQDVNRDSAEGFAELRELPQEEQSTRGGIAQIARSEPATFADDDRFDFDSAAVALTAKPVQVNFASEVEPPVVLAQNSPTRKQPVRSPVALPSPLEDLESDLEAPPRKVSNSTKPEPPDGIESLADANLSDEEKAKLTTLREKLAELTKAKAELINEQTLSETIATLEQQISDLHAAQKLLSAQQILKALAEEFPNSPAAAKAKRMLEAAETKKAPKPSRTTIDLEEEHRS